MCVSIYVCVVCIFVWMHTCVFVPLCICVYAHLCMFVFSCACMCMCLFISVSMFFVYLYTISYGSTIILLHVSKRLSWFYSMLLIVPLQCVLKSGIYCHPVKSGKLQICSSFPITLVFVWGVLFVTLSYYIEQRKWKWFFIEIKWIKSEGQRHLVGSYYPWCSGIWRYRYLLEGR